MQQLPALDAVFLSMETPETPGHIGGLAILDPTSHPDEAFDYERFVEFVAERLSLCPRFSWRLQEVPLGMDLPYWVEDPEMDFSQHVHRLALPSPGGHHELAEIAGHLFPRALDRDRPLWEMILIEGLQGGRVALLWKIHHCLMDGVSGAGLVELLFDMQPEPASQPLVPVDANAEAGEAVSAFAMLANGVFNAARRPGSMLRHLGNAGKQVVDQLRDAGLAGVASAPRACFNGVVGTRRSVAWSRVSLERVKNLKSALDVTVNDIVLGVTGDAVRRYLDRRGELPEETLVAAIPVSTRAKGDTSIGNQISQMGVTWGTHIGDPVERVLAIHESTTRAKRSAKGASVNIIAALGESLSPGLLSMFSRVGGAAADRTPLPSNAVVSNVPMSPIPLYIAGAKIEGMVPMSVLAPTQGFNITVISYNGEMHFGVIGDPDLVDSVWEIADAIPKSLVDLEMAAASDSLTAGQGPTRA